MWPHAGWWSWFNEPFHLARSRTNIFFFWACSTANFQFPCQTYLTHICCMPIRLWERRGPKAQPSVNVTIPLVSECCSAWMLLWFLGWGESDSPEKRTIYTVNCGYTLTCSPSRTKGDLQGLKERNILRPHRVMRWPTRVVHSPRRILGGRKTSRFSRKPDPRDLFQARCSLGSVAFRAWGKHSGFVGRVGPRNSGQVGSEFSLTSWTCSCKPCFLDLSFGVAPVCCHSEKTKRVLKTHGIQL